MTSVRWGVVFAALSLTACPERASPSAKGVGAQEAASSSAEELSPSAEELSRVQQPLDDGYLPEGLAPDSPWASHEACLRAVQGSPRTESRPPRLGTWNIRWYPDGRPGKKAAASGTDILWLACAIAWLDVDLLAVQEMKTLPRAQARTAELLAELGRLRGGTWRAAFDECPHGATQHVGLIWNEERVRMSELGTEAALNPHGSACRDTLRPGFGGLARFPSDVRVHVMSVHLKSGPERRSLELREKSLSALGQVLTRVRAEDPAAEMVFAGDFNTMGCSRCSPKVAAREEQTAARHRVSADGFHWVLNEPACTHYYRGRGETLDAFVVTSGLVRHKAPVAKVSGLCGEIACRPASQVGRAAAFQRLSDHCPVVLELSGG